MAMRNRFRRHVSPLRLQAGVALTLFAALLMLFACDSSDTRSTTRSATSGPYELQVRIIAPANGSVIELVGGETDVTFTSSVTGGTEPIGLTWTLNGPTMSNTSTGDSPTITILELGRHAVVLTARDATGLTASESITVTFTIGGSVTTTTTPTTTTTTTTTP